MSTATAVEVADNPNTRRKQRQAARLAMKQGGTGNGPQMTENATLGLPEPVQVASLRLEMRAPVVAKASRLYQQIVTTIPSCILLAALQDPLGIGYDPGKVADPDNDYTADDAANEFRLFGRALRRSEEETSSSGQILGAFADVLAEVCIPWSGDAVTRESLPALLRENLTASDFADLTRRLLECLDGTTAEFVRYEGSASERIYFRSDGQATGDAAPGGGEEE